MFLDAMLDWETLSTQPDAVVISVGIVLFNRDENDTYEILEASPEREFFATIEFQDQIDTGRHVMASTLMWWMQQNRSAQKETFNPKGRMPTVTALQNIVDLVGDRRLWGNGASFDNPILATLCTDFGIEAPPFYMARDLRTIKELSTNKPLGERGVEHSAIEDARFQVLCCQEYYRGL